MVDVSFAAGLHLVSNTLELLDASGTPRLRVAPPSVIDAGGARHEARIAVDGCAYDTNPAAPWRRPVVSPGAASCGVRVSWHSAVYPAIVDPAWVATGSMAAARVSHSATLLPSGDVLISGGYDSGFLSSAELFDGVGTFAATGALLVARSDHTATLLQSGKVLIAGGEGSTSYLSEAELFDGTGTFTATGSMTTGRTYQTATLLSTGKVLVTGGLAGGAPYLSSAELYDGASTFTATGSMSTARINHIAALLPSGKVLVAGGSGGSAGILSTAELFDGTGTFAATGSMTSMRVAASATLLGSGKVLVAGGEAGDTNGTQVSTAELFDGTSTFAATGSMTGARSNQTSTRLASGQVLIAGGDDNGQYVVPTSQVFDGTATFALTGSMITARATHTATLLDSGKVLVAGGEDSSGVLSTAELFAFVPPGGTCVSGGDCLSGSCNDGTCCSGACTGTCMTCTAGTGACVAVENAPDPDTCTGTKTCDPNGVCKLVVGQACPNGVSDCADALCADGYCCNTACGNACDVCAASLGASANGTCSPAPVGYAGNPACGNGFACDGTGVTCPTAPCASDADCLTNDYCAAGGACQARKGVGATCNIGAGGDCASPPCGECASDQCVDGVCCNTECTGLCQACAGPLQQNPNNGICGNAKDDINPHGDSCPLDPASSCGPNGMCNGAGGWLYYPSGTACGPTVCSGTTVSGQICDGAGKCDMSSSASCDPYLCTAGGSGAGCTTSCTSDTGCASDAYCSGGTCTKKAASGACTAADQCTSGNCVDGYCCNSACTGECEACDVSGSEGSCSAVSGAPHGKRTACAAGSASTPCAAAVCDGNDRTECAGFAGSDVTCRAVSCTNGTQTAAAECDGHGNCPAATTIGCAAYVCGATACKTSCASNADCSGNGACMDGQCVSGSTCSANGQDVVDPTGKSTPCAPYVCAGGQCKTTCGTVSDCVEPDVCDSNERCVAPPSPSATGSGGGCSLWRASAGGASGAWSLLALVVASAGFRRRRRRSAPRRDARTRT